MRESDVVAERRAGRGASSPEHAPFASIVLLVASLVLRALLAYVGRWLTFWSDEWSWILHRPDPSIESRLGGSEVHLHLFPVLIYQSFFRLVGLNSSVMKGDPDADTR